MLRVTIYGLDNGKDQKMGSIAWDGKKLIPSNAMMRQIMQKPVWVADASGIEDVYAKDDPLRFLKSLHLHYKGIALRAGEAEDDGTANAYNPEEPRRADGKFGSGDSGEPSGSDDADKGKSPSSDAGELSASRAGAIARKVAGTIKNTIKKAAGKIDDELNNGVTSIIDGVKTRSPRTIAYGIAQAVTSSYNYVHEEVFEFALSQHSIKGIHGIAATGANLAAAVWTKSLKKVIGSFGSLLHGLVGNADDEDSQNSDERMFDGSKNSVDALVLDHATRGTLEGLKVLWQELGITAPLPKAMDVRDNLWQRLRSAARGD